MGRCPASLTVSQLSLDVEGCWGSGRGGVGGGMFSVKGPCIT